MINGFEILSITDTGSTYDLSKLTGSAINTVKISATGGPATVSNITNQAIIVSGEEPTTVTLSAKTADSTVSLERIPPVVRVLQ